MPSSQLVSQIDFNQYTSDSSTQNHQQLNAVQGGNSRSAYLDQLKEAFQKNNQSAERTARKKTISSRKPVPELSTTKRQTTPSQQAKRTKVSASEINAKPQSVQEESGQVQVAQPHESTSVNKIEQSTNKSQPVTHIENVVDPEILTPPIYINELFQQQDQQVEEINELGIPISIDDINLPPSGLVTQLISLDSEVIIVQDEQVAELDISSISVTPELSAVSEDVIPQLTVTIPPNIEEDHRQETNTNISDVVSVKKTRSVGQTIVENVSSQETLAKEKQQLTVQQVDGTELQNKDVSIILPEQKKSDTIQKETLQETVTTENNGAEQLQPQGILQPALLVPQENSIEPPVELELINEISNNRSTDQTQLPETRSTPKISVSEKTTDRLDATDNLISTPAFSNGLADQMATTDVKGNAITAQEESILNQTADAVHSSIEQGESLSIRLTPPELGMIQINLNIEDGVISARLVVQTPEAHSSIMQHLQTLQESLELKGTPVENITIQIATRTTEDQASSDTNHSEEQQSNKEKNKQNQKQDAETKEEEQLEEQTDGDQLNIAA